MPADYFTVQDANRAQEESRGGLLEQIARRKAGIAKETGLSDKAFRREKREQDTDWWSSTASGAAGGAVFGPAGAAVGAGLFGLPKFISAMNQRAGEGQGWMEAFGNTLFDFKPITSGRALQPLANAASAIAPMVGSSETGLPPDPRGHTGGYGEAGGMPGLTSEDFNRMERTGMTPEQMGYKGYDPKKVFGK